MSGSNVARNAGRQTGPTDHALTASVAVHVGLLRAWTVALLRGVGTPADIAADVAEVLVASDRRGIASHGTARLPQYVALVESNVLDPRARPRLERSKPALARFDAANGWGPHAGKVAVDWAIAAARIQGIASAVVRHSNHYGIAGWYALRMAAAGMIGISLTNASPLVAPTRAKAPLIGTNPIAVAAPAGRWGAFCLDMATSTVARGKLEVAARRGEPIPVGWAIDADGRPTTDPAVGLGGALQPLGGDERTGGYKGYGLGLAVDLLTGVVAGAAFGPSIVPLFSTHDGEADLGHLFMAIDPAAIDQHGAFEGRLERYLDALTAAPTIAGAPGRVIVPGEPEADAERRSDEHGVALDRAHHLSLVVLGERLAVPFPAHAEPAA
jgi:LDH2 family malate/lactate/ureidoglycolate dehydrogenase